MDNKKAYLKIYIKITLDFLLVILIASFMIFVLPKLIYYFMPFVIGWFISLLANPMVRFLEKRIKIVRKHGSVITIIFAIVLISFLIYFGIVMLIDQLIGFIKAAPSYYSHFQKQMESLMTKYDKIYDRTPKAIQSYLDSFMAQLSDNNSMDMFQNFDSFDLAGNAVKNFASAIVFIIFTILAAYFFTADKDKMEKRLYRFIPKRVSRQFNLISEIFMKAVWGYIVAQLKITLILIIIMYISLTVLSVKYAFLIAIGIGLLDFLPIFGAGAILWPWAAYCLLINDYFMATGLIILYALCQITRQVLQPKLVGDSIGLSSFATLVLLFIGYRIGGLLGIVIAIPVGMIVISLHRAGAFDTLFEDIRFLLNQLRIFYVEAENILLRKLNSTDNTETKKEPTKTIVGSEIDKNVIKSNNTD